MLDKSNQGIVLKLSRLFDHVAPELEIQSFISVEAMRQGISKSLIPLGHSRCFDTVENHLKNMQKFRDFKDTTSSIVVRDNSPLGLSVMNSPPSPCKKLNRGTNYGTTKHQGFCSKRHFSFSPRDKSHCDVFLPLIYPGLHIWQIIHQVSQEGARQVFTTGGSSIMRQTRIPTPYLSTAQRGAPQLAKRTLHRAVPVSALRCTVGLTDQVIKKVAWIRSPRNPVRLLDVLSLAVSFGNSGGCVH